MMGIVNLFDKVRDRELKLMRPEASRLILGREAMTRPQIEEDVRSLADQEPASLQERRSKWPIFFALAFEQRHDRTVASLPPDVAVIGTRRLEREPDVLAASLDLGPIVELISHGGSPCHRTAAEGRRRMPTVRSTVSQMARCSFCS